MENEIERKARIENLILQIRHEKALRHYNRNYPKIPKDCANPNLHSWDGSRNWSGYVERFEQNITPHNANKVCFKCEKTFKSTGYTLKHTKESSKNCPQCNKELFSVGVTIRVPRKGSNKWKNFRKKFQK